MLRKLFSKSDPPAEQPQASSSDAQAATPAKQPQPGSAARHPFNPKAFLKKRWPVIAVLLIIALSMHIRLAGFYGPDGDPRWPYLRNIDSYFFVRNTEDTIDANGVIPAHDDLSLVPEGRSRRGTFYTYLSAYAYTVLGGGQPVPDFMAWFPVILASLTAIPAYFIGRTLYDRKAGALTAVFFTLSPTIMSRTLGGDPDSDAIIMLMLATSLAAYLFLYKKMDRKKLFGRRNILLSGAAGLAMAVFALSWSGYFFALWIVTSFVIFKILIDIILTRGRAEGLKRVIPASKTLLGTFVMLLVVFEVFTVPFFGPDFALNPVQSVFGSLGLAGRIKAESGSFPNVLVSIAELQVGGDARQVAIRSAGVDTAASVSRLPLEAILLISPFILTLAALVYLGYAYWQRREHLDTLLFLSLWFVGMLYASTVAVRFGAFVAPLFAVAASIILSKLWDVALSKDDGSVTA